MARFKCHPEPSSIPAEVSDVSTKITQDRRKEDDAKENSDASDLEPPPSSPTKKTKAAAKRKPRRSIPAKSIPTSPAVTSSSTTTPQPEQGPKRKGGNKRKWTHEYCLTCTRYGRACGGRREGEEGCAVCRDPDRSKGEKLRECLWADPEAGITDYKTAREIFKKAQAEARAQRARPQSKRQQSSNAPVSSTTPRNSGPALDPSALASKYFSAGDLPQTTKPLNLQPPALVRSSYSTQQTEDASVNHGDTVTVDRSQLAAHPSVASAPHDYLPRIHRPQLIYVAIDSDSEEKAFTTGQGSRPGTTSRKHQGPPVHQSGCPPVAYFDADLNAWIRPMPVRTPSTNASRYYAHPYRSAYDAPPVPPPHLVAQGDNSCQLEPPRRGSFDARTPVAPSSLSLDKSSSPPRKWSIGGSKITSINGYDWKAKAWKPTDNPKDGEFMDTTGKIESRATLTTSVSDTSSLSSYMSIDEGTINGAAAGASGIQEVGADDIHRPTNSLKRKYEQTITESAGPIEGSNPVDTTNTTALHINLGSQITKIPAGASIHTLGRKSLATFQQPVTFTFPGEITIQQDEEDGNSASDSELTSDEGKLKSLPSKIRKLLSRSRVTKVIIGDDVFEIRPKTNIPPTKTHVNLPSAGEMVQSGVRGRGRKQAQKRNSKISAADHVDETDEEEGTNTKKPVQAGDEETKTNRLPIKIKLIFKSKIAPDPCESLETTSKHSATKTGAINASALADSNETDNA